MARILFFLLLLTAWNARLGRTQEDLEITSISPHRGSLNGGTQLTVHGRGFSTDLTLNATNPIKELFLVSEYRSYDCLVDIAASDEDQVVCETEPMAEDTYYIRMRQNNVDLSLDKICGGYTQSYSCRFNVYSSRSPLITRLSFKTGEPQQLLTIYGRIYSNKTSSSVVSATSGSTAAIQRVYSTGGTCKLFDENNELFGATLEGAEGESDWGSITCKMISTFAGIQNVSMILNEDLGRSLVDKSIVLLSADNQLYNLQTYAVVTDVNPKQGSTEGGTELTIDGRWFYNVTYGEAKVLVGGVECDVTSVTPTQIKCTTRAQPTSQVVYSGGRGMVVEIYHDNTDISSTLESSAADRKFFVDSSYTSDSNFVSEDQFVSRSRGFFIPAISGNYQFIIKGNDIVQLRVNPNGKDPAGATEITTTTAADTYAYSSSLPLDAGTEYYYEIRHHDSSSNAYYEVDVYSDKTLYTSLQTSLSINEKQTIEISAPVVKETHTIMFDNWSNETSVESVWLLEFQCQSSTCDGYGFSFRLFKTNSDVIQYSSDMLSSALKNVLDRLVVLGSDTVDVAGTNGSFNITFKSDRGYMPLETVISSVQSDLQISLTATTIGKPSLESFTLMMNGQVSPAVAYNGTSDSVREAVKSFFGPLCPPQVESGIGSSTIVYNDIENDHWPSGAKSSETSYCGSFSLRNPSYLFYDTENSYKPEGSPNLCFAYKGALSSTVRVRLNYYLQNEEGGIDFKDDNFYFSFENEIISTDSWRHVCLDLYSEMLAAVPDGLTLKVSQVQVYVAQGDVYMDNIFIGRSTFEAIQLEIYAQQIIPAAVSHIKVETIEVEKTGNSYVITYNPFDCGFDFPLLGIAFGEQISESTNQAEYEIGVGSATVQIHRDATASLPVTGTFDLGFDNPDFQSLSNVPANISAIDLRNRLHALKNIHQVEGARSGTCAGYSWELTFVSPGGDYPSMTTNGNSLSSSPGPVTIVAQTLTDGGLRMGPVYGDFFRTAHDVPQVQVFIQDIPSACIGSGDSDSFDFCNFQWTDAATPTITALSSTEISNGDTVTITGTGFDADPSANLVVVDGKEFNVTSASSTSLTIVVDGLQPGFQSFEVFVKGKGKALLSITDTERKRSTTNGLSGEIFIDPSNTQLDFNVLGIVFLVFPNLSFDDYAEGGFSVIVGGEGCPPEPHLCYEKRAVVCRIPSGQRTGEILINWSGRIDITVPGLLEELQTSCVVTNVSPYNTKISGGELVTITGTGFGSVAGFLQVGCEEPQIAAWTDTEIKFMSPALGPGSYPILIHTNSSIICDIALFWLNYQFEITSISPSIGSILGGTSVTLHGNGFVDGMTVKLGNSEYIVTNVNEDGTEGIFTTGPSKEPVQIRNNGEHPEFGKGYAWNPGYAPIEVGQTVIFLNTPQNFIKSTFLIDIFTTSSSSNDTYDGNGFEFSAAESGVYSVDLNVEGDFFYSSKCLIERNDNCELRLFGQIVVSSATLNSAELSAHHGSSEAVVETPIHFNFDPNTTPRLDGISSNEGIAGDEITIQGSRLEDVKEVLFGDRQVTDVSATNSEISFIIKKEDEIKSGRQRVSVTTDEGLAVWNVLPIEKRYFRLIPEVTSVSPTCGSLQGGTELEIQGFGFDAETLDRSFFSGFCSISSVNYTTIKCKTEMQLNGGTRNIQLDIGSEETFCNASACAFTFEESCTPEIDEITYSATASGLDISVSGRKLDPDMNEFEFVMVGEFTSPSATILESSETEIKAEVTEFHPAGTYLPSLNVKNKGYAKLPDDNEYVKPFVLESITPNQGSIAGGQSVTLEGNGFVKNNTEVLLGDVPCSVSAIADTTFTCITGRKDEDIEVEATVTLGSMSYHTNVTYSYSSQSTPAVTLISPSEGFAGDEVTFGGNFHSDQLSDFNIVFGDVTCDATDASATSLTCTLPEKEAGVVTPEVFVAGLGRATNTAQFTYNLVLENIEPNAGSYGGGQIVTLNGKGFASYMSVEICDHECVIGVVNNTYAQCVTPAMDLGSATKDCDVKVSLNDLEYILNNGYTYDPDLTCSVTGATPDRGGTGGGTEITITGTGFPLNDVIVEIDSANCEITSLSESEIVCTTNSHVGSIRAPVVVTCGSNGNAVSSADFYYADRWSSRFTWGGISPPTEGAFVIIPEGQTIILDESTPILKMLLINGGTLLFDNYLTEDGAILNAENILVVNNGVFQIGTEEEPYLKKAEIVMHGNLRSPELPIYGAKTLGVREGTLDLHGKPVTMQWTLLSATANAGDTQITLEHPVDWKAGDHIAIASTGTRHSQAQNEKKEITAVSADKRTLTLNESLDFTHLGITQTHCGTNIEYRAEVGLLTRNIVFRGSNDPQWHDLIPKCEDGFHTGQFATQTCFQGRFGEEIGSDEFGASIMLHSPKSNTADEKYITARIENVEVTYAGQAFRLGRYPIHSHLMGDMSNSYVRSCAIHKSFNRAVTIHGTHNLLVEHNVVYDIMGGAIFIEDGIETGNIIQYNLAIFVRQSTSLLTEDITPAAYWVTNPDNTIRHNHGAGGTHFCFWYRMNGHPDGPSFTSNVCQQGVELGEFQNNTCHSQGWFGLWLFPTYFPVVGGSCGSSTPSPAKFHSLTAWHCEKGAEWVNCGAIHFIDFVLSDHEDSGLDLKLVKNVAIEKERGALIQNAVVVGHTDIHSSSETKFGIILPFSGGMHLEEICLENFNRGGAGFRLTAIQGTCTFLCGGFEMYFKNIMYNDVSKRVHFRYTHEAVFIDEDGSLLGEGNNFRLVPHTNIMNKELCVIQSGNLYSSGVTAAICDPSISFIRMGLNSALPSSLHAKELFVENMNGNTSSVFAKKRLTHPQGWMILLESGHRYDMWWENGEQFTNLTYNAKFYYVKTNDYVIITHNLPQTIDRATISGDNGNLVDSLEDLSTVGDYVYSPDVKRIDYIIRNNGSQSSANPSAFEPYSFENPGSLRHYGVNPRFIKCAITGCQRASGAPQVSLSEEKPLSFQYWSHNETSCVRDPCRIPRADDDGALCWVVMDKNSTDCDILIIEGILEVDSTNESFLIRARTVLVLGGRLIAGLPSKPFTGNFEIRLWGNHSSEGYPMDVGEVGAKALGVLGGLDLHGMTHDVSWTRLEETVNAGGNTITVQDEVDWVAGDEIVITTTGYRSQETEKGVIASVGSDRKTIVLNEALEYRHLGESYSVEDRSYSMRAEVGLLTRNIRIIGETYIDIDDEAFGARVLIAGGIEGGEIYSGWARITNVEFHRTGQEGWTEPYDPRFSLAWLNTGTASDENPSYAKSNAFHDGYSTAIGTFGADGIEISDNVIHRTIHDGIRITGKNHILKNNIVTIALFRGSWGDRFELKNFQDWHASFQLSKAENLTLEGNVAAGSERIGFHTGGEACSAHESTAWKDNVAHGCLHGLHIFLNDGVGDCSMLRNFLVYKSWDYGVYFQTGVSVVVRNTTVVDSFVAFMPIIVGPSPIAHAYENKCIRFDNVTCVGRSPDFRSDLDFMDQGSDKNLKIRSAGPDRAAPRNPTGGSTCIILPIFASGGNGAPFKGFHFQKTYPAILGSLLVSGLYAQNYVTRNNNRRDLILWTCPTNEDANHPVILAGTRLIDVEESSKVLIDHASIGKINPSDCVDMECDAKKKVLIKDLDGGLLNGVGAIISESEAFWDGDLRRGLGDYRIPKTFLTEPDGTRLPVDDVIDDRGIIRSPSCTLNEDWQAYNCHGDDALDYRMLVIESMDEDTETRRLSPLAIIGDRYIDLLNGPQDHGWCFGYTCQKRLSTFWAVVANNKSFEIYFTGYAPRHLRLRVLRSGTCSGNGIEGLEQSSDIAIRVAIFFLRPERLDVHLPERNNIYIYPRNSEWRSDSWVLTAEKDIPAIDSSSIHGDNYFDFENRLQYVLLTDEAPVDIDTAPAVYVKVGMAAISIDDFFGENIVSNLANFLNIPQSNIFIVNVVRETSRRKRDTSLQTAEYTLMFTTTITNDSSVDADDVVAIETLNNASRTLIIAMQSNLLSEIMNATITSFAASLIDRNNSGEVIDDFNIVYNVPTTLSFSSLPSSVEEYTVFSQPITVTLLDVDQNPVATLDDVFEVTVTLDKSVDGADPSASLLGDTSVMFTNGTANFSNLVITHQGTYKLNFQVTQPVNVMLNAINIPSLVVTQRTVNLNPDVIPNYIYHGEDVTMTFQLINSALQPLQYIGFKGHTWKLNVTFDDSSIYGTANLGSTTTFTFDTSTGTVETTGLQLTGTTSFYRYILHCRAYTEPALYDIDIYTEPIEFLFANEVAVSLPEVSSVTFVLSGQINSARSSNPSLDTAVTYINNKMVDELDGSQARLGNVNGSITSNGNTELSFTLSAANDNASENALQNIEKLFNESSSGLSYNGRSLQFADSSCGLQVDNQCRNAASTSSVAVVTPAVESETWIFIVVGVVVAVVLAALIIAFACVMKRAKLNKVGLMSGKCADASSSRGSSPLMDSFNGSTPMTTPGFGSQMGNYPQWDKGITPVQR